MKMIRTLSLLLGVAFCFLCGCAPADPEPLEVPYMDIPYKTVAEGAFNDISPVEPATVASPWVGSSFQNENALPEKTITFLGETYEGTYDRSYIDTYTSFTADYYDSDSAISFAVETGTDRIVSWQYMGVYSSLHIQKPDLENAEEFAVSYAREHAATVIDLARYEMSVSTDPPNVKVDNITFYYITFEKKVNGFSSMDYISYKISSKGTLATYTAGERPGTFDGCENPDCTEEMIETSVKYEMSLQAAPISYYCKDVEYEWRLYVMRPDGQYGVYSRIDVYWQHSKSLEVSKSAERVFTKFGDRALMQAPTE